MLYSTFAMTQEEWKPEHAQALWSQYTIRMRYVPAWAGQHRQWERATGGWTGEGRGPFWTGREARLGGWSGLGREWIAAAARQDPNPNFCHSSLTQADWLCTHKITGVDQSIPIKQPRAFLRVKRIKSPYSKLCPSPIQWLATVYMAIWFQSHPYIDM